MNGRRLFNLYHPLADRYQLTLEQDASQYTIWMRQSCNGFARLFTTSDAELASSIMNTTADALQCMAMAMAGSCVKPQKKWGMQWLLPGAMFIFLAGTWISWFHYSPLPALPVEMAVEPVVNPPQPLPTLSSPPVTNALPVAEVNPPTQRVPLSPKDAAEARHLLATRLKNGAAKKEFTISLSSGHPRTLYVFADPECPNCSIFEPTVQALSELYNVEIFPVTLIGKARTAEKVVPLLCTTAEKRADRWRRLFDVGAGLLNPTATSEPPSASCEAGQNALARNDMAFELYRLPGTPTVISDDGRMIPLQAMASDVALQAFLNSAP
ncbi:hypothetical protein [Serratia sp. MMO-28]|uniref:hypothetical protein n=1 Tax=Serratia sp. MMO-28 TaxID=3081678 RepID=UPI0030765AF7